MKGRQSEEEEWVRGADEGRGGLKDNEEVVRNDEEELNDGGEVMRKWGGRRRKSTDSQRGR